ncbi:MAG: hypothetical protein NVSMB54_31080 [Ktedonobacteraceae bacterium]
MTNERNGESMPYDVNAFCTLLARIMHRCLIEKDARFLALISVPPTEVTTSVTVQKSEVIHDQAA